MLNVVREARRVWVRRPFRLPFNPFSDGSIASQCSYPIHLPMCPYSAYCSRLSVVDCGVLVRCLSAVNVANRFSAVRDGKEGSLFEQLSEKLTVANPYEVIVAELNERLAKDKLSVDEACSVALKLFDRLQPPMMDDEVFSVVSAVAKRQNLWPLAVRTVSLVYGGGQCPRSFGPLLSVVLKNPAFPQSLKVMVLLETFGYGHFRSLSTTDVGLIAESLLKSRLGVHIIADAACQLLYGADRSEFALGTLSSLALCMSLCPTIVVSGAWNELIHTAKLGLLSTAGSLNVMAQGLLPSLIESGFGEKSQSLLRFMESFLSRVDWITKLDEKTVLVSMEMLVLSGVPITRDTMKNAICRFTTINGGMGKNSSSKEAKIHSQVGPLLRFTLAMVLMRSEYPELVEDYVTWVAKQAKGNVKRRDLAPVLQELPLLTELDDSLDLIVPQCLLLRKGESVSAIMSLILKLCHSKRSSLLSPQAVGHYWGIAAVLSWNRSFQPRIVKECSDVLLCSTVNLTQLLNAYACELLLNTEKVGFRNVCEGLQILLKHGGAFPHVALTIFRQASVWEKKDSFLSGLSTALGLLFNCGLHLPLLSDHVREVAKKNASYVTGPLAVSQFMDNLAGGLLKETSVIALGKALNILPFELMGIIANLLCMELEFKASDLLGKLIGVMEIKSFPPAVEVACASYLALHDMLPVQLKLGNVEFVQAALDTGSVAFTHSQLVFLHQMAIGRGKEGLCPPYRDWLLQTFHDEEKMLYEKRLRASISPHKHLLKFLSEKGEKKCNFGVQLKSGVVLDAVVAGESDNSNQSAFLLAPDLHSPNKQPSLKWRLILRRKLASLEGYDCSVVDSAEA